MPCCVASSEPIPAPGGRAGRRRAGRAVAGRRGQLDHDTSVPAAHDEATTTRRRQRPRRLPDASAAPRRGPARRPLRQPRSPQHVGRGSTASVNGSTRSLQRHAPYGVTTVNSGEPHRPPASTPRAPVAYGNSAIIYARPRRLHPGRPGALRHLLLQLPRRPRPRATWAGPQPAGPGPGHRRLLGDHRPDAGRDPQRPGPAQAAQLTDMPGPRGRRLRQLPRPRPRRTSRPSTSRAANLADGASLFALNCAACHTITGAGDALAYGTYAPSLHYATTTQVAEAIRTGPGNMPRFTGNLTDSQVRDIVAYVTEQHPAPVEPRRVRPGRASARWPRASSALLFGVGGARAHLLLDRGPGMSHHRDRHGPDGTEPWRRRRERRRRPADEHRTPVALPAARLDDPHLQPAARHPERVELIAVSSWSGIAGRGRLRRRLLGERQPWILGVTLGVGLFLLGLRADRLGQVPDAPGPLRRGAPRPALQPRPSGTPWRPPWSSGPAWWSSAAGVLGGLLAAGLGVFGIVALFPLLRSLGPVAQATPWTETNWRARVAAGRHQRPGHPRRRLEVPGASRPSSRPASRTPTSGQAVRPDGAHPGPADPDPVTQTGRTDWAPTGYVAYSKLCTHLGCPVGLYEQRARAAGLPVPPVDVQRAERGHAPVRPGPPAAAPAPALRSTRSGYLRAQAGYDQPVGPGFWERTSVTRHAMPTASPAPSGRPRRPSAPTAGSARPSTSSTTAWAWPRAAGSSWTRSSPTTGPSCWARSPCTRSSSSSPPGSS